MKIFSKRLLASMVKKLVIPSIGVLALIIFSSFILFEATKATIDITENGETETVKTHANTVGELLKEQELIVGEHDWLSHDIDRKSTRLNSSHVAVSYAVFCLKYKTTYGQ